jgi:hypothetical protein
LKTLFISKRYLSAITLAGAADGIFCGLIKVSGGKVPAERTWDEIEHLRKVTGHAWAGERTKSEAFNEWNNTRNRLKHHDVGKDELTLTIEPIVRSYEEIMRVRESSKQLGMVAMNWNEFENCAIPLLFL